MPNSTECKLGGMCTCHYRNTTDNSCCHNCRRMIE